VCRRHIWSIIVDVFLFLFLFFLLAVMGFELRLFVRQVLYHLNHTSSTMYFSSILESWSHCHLSLGYVYSTYLCIDKFSFLSCFTWVFTYLHVSVSVIPKSTASIPSVQLSFNYIFLLAQRTYS
jgi:hypothetical protein